MRGRIVAAAARVEHQCHQAAAHDDREHDPEPHRHIAPGRDRGTFDRIPRIDRKPDRDREQRDQWQDDGELAHRYFGCTLWSPPGEPGGGTTFMAPPSGGFCCISRSMPAGGQITPFDDASLSERLPFESSFPSPGAFALVPGGQSFGTCAGGEVCALTLVAAPTRA